MLQLIIDQTFGQFVSIDVRDEDKVDRDDSLGKYDVCTVYYNEESCIIFHSENQYTIFRHLMSYHKPQHVLDFPTLFLKGN